MDISEWELVALVLTSAFGGGVGGQALTWIKEWQFERRKEQVGRRLRQEEAAIRARDLLIDDAGGVLAWIDFEWAQEYGREAEFYSPREKPSLETIGSALSALHRVSTRHPNRSVRELAEKLHESLDSAYGDATRIDERRYTGERFPVQTQFESWHDQAKQLVEAIHDAPFNPGS